MDVFQRIEEISISAATIGVDRYLGKNISKYSALIKEHIEFLNSYLDDEVQNGSPMYDYIVNLTYQLYRLRDEAEGS